MAKIKTPNQRKAYLKLNSRINGYLSMIEGIFNTLSSEASSLVLGAGYSSDSGNEFRWSDYPQTRDGLLKLQSRYVSDIRGVLTFATSKEWSNSNEAQDLIANTVLRKYTHNRNGRIEHYYRDNSDALKAFQTRVDNNMNLSQKLWKQSGAFKNELEAALSVAIERGDSAITLSKRVSQYLIDFGTLKKDYKDKYGKAAKIENCEYKSARLARTEINMAYRKAEQLRWQQFDFVVGYEIKVTQNGKHEPDICDDLADKYPKSFVWAGWHPNCKCYQIPILKDADELYSSEKSENEIDKLPYKFTNWMDKNKERIVESEARGTLPYFLTDNNLRPILDDIGNTEKQYEHITIKLADIDTLIAKKGLTHDEAKHELRIQSVINATNCNLQTAEDYIDAAYSFSYKWDWEIRQYQMGNKNIVSKYGHSLEDIKKKAETLERFIKDSQKFEGVTYRGITLSEEELDSIINSKDGEITMKGASSWSTDEYVALDFCENGMGKSDLNGNEKTIPVIFVCDYQPHGTSTSHLSHFITEYEVVVSNKARWSFEKLTEYDYGVKYIKINPYNYP